jgi:hypothetical protein
VAGQLPCLGYLGWSRFTMARTSFSTDLDTLLRAYALLGLSYTATSRDAQRAYRELARRHHPDRVPADSPGHEDATSRMAAINAAYQLARHAPLRHHPIARGSDPDLVFTQDQTDEALRRARGAQRVERVMTAVACVVVGAFLCFCLMPVLGAAGLPFGVSLLIALGCAAIAIAVRRSLDPFAAMHGFAALVRVLLTLTR